VAFDIADPGTLGDWGNGKTVAVTSSGQLWITFRDTTSGHLEFWYSNDNGASWAEDTGAKFSYSPTMFSLFIDGRDQIWLAFRQGTDVGVRVGTISGNAITWNGTEWTASTRDPTQLDVVAFAEGTGDRVWVMWGDSIGFKVNSALWNGSSFGSETGETTLESGGTAQDPVQIDFNHTGDGKTIQSGSPHVWLAWHQGGTLYSQKFVWSSGPSWSPNAVRTISTTINNKIAAFWDGTRFVMVALQFDGDIEMWERNASDDTTTDQSPGSQPTGRKTSADEVDAYYAQATQDVFVLLMNTSSYPSYVQYDRSGDSWDSAVTVIEAEACTAIQVANNADASPQSEILPFWQISGPIVRSETGNISLNAAPTAPTITSPTDGQVKDVAEALPVVWTFNDPDEGDAQSAYSLRKQIGTGSYSYWNGSVFTASEGAATKIASSGTTHTISSSWGADGDANHKYAIKTWDAADAGPSDWDEVYVTPSAQDNPTVTAITTVTAPTYSVTWTVATQTKYRVRVYDDSGGSPVTSTVFYDSGTLVSAVTSHSTPFPDNSVTRHVGVQTWNDEGLLSDEDTEQLAVSYLVPPTPTVSMSTTGSESGVIWVSINNPTPGGGETITDSNDVYRRVASEGGDGIRVAQGVAEDGGFNDYGPLSEVVYQYRARAINAGIGTAAYGAWTT
jgi:hypothetical protein